MGNRKHGPRSVPLSPLRCLDAPLRTIQALDAEKETWEPGPGRAHLPPLDPWCHHSVSGTCPKAVFWGGWRTKSKLVSVITCTCYLNVSLVREVFLSSRELSRHSSQSDTLPVSSHQLWSSGFYKLMPMTAEPWKQEVSAKDGDWHIDINIHVLSTVCMCMCMRVCTERDTDESHFANIPK